MTTLLLTVFQALSIAGSAFILGITVGWILALLQLGGSVGRSGPCDEDE